MGPEKLDVLLLGDHRQILTVICSLACLGYRIIVGQTNEERYGTWSRYCSETWTHPAIKGDGSRFIETLNRFLQADRQATVLFPIGDDEIRVLTDHRDSLPDNVSVIMPAREIVELCHDKIAMCRFIDETDIPQAPYEIVTTGEALAKAAERIGYPCVIRPSDQFIRLKGEKVIICYSSTDITELDNDPVVRNNARMVQQYVYGPRHNFHFIAGHGKLERYVETKALRTNRLDGTGLSVDGISVEPHPEIVTACKMLVQRLDYTGLGLAQFLMDEAGELKCFLEVNPRLAAAIALPQACGVDFPKLAIEQLQGHAPSNDPPGAYRRDIRFGWLYGDIWGLYHAVRMGGSSAVDILKLLMAIMRTFLSARVHPTWNLFDPIPTFAAYCRLAFAGIRKLLRIVLKKR